MKNFIFKTTATMKDYNCEKWWIDSSIVGEIHISAENIREALEKYRAIVEEKHHITISNNAIKNKSKMYVDTPTGEAKQVGYVITGKTEMQDDFYRWSAQYVDLWVEIITVVNTDFGEV